MKVLLALDGSPHSHAALTEFATRPWPDDTEVQILKVVHAPIPLLFEPTLVVAAAHMEEILELRGEAPALLKAASDLIRDAAPGRRVTTKIVEGIPKDAIVQEAEEWDADLIVLGSHGYGRFRQTVLGSVASAVVAKAPCSVQVVRAKHLPHETERDASVPGVEDSNDPGSLSESMPPSRGRSGRSFPQLRIRLKIEKSGLALLSEGLTTELAPDLWVRIADKRAGRHSDLRPKGHDSALEPIPVANELRSYPGGHWRGRRPG